MQFQAIITVSVKPVINDPQGLSVTKALKELGFSGVKSVRVGKSIAVMLEATNRKVARKQVKEMCANLLANPVIEDSTFVIKSLDDRS